MNKITILGSGTTNLVSGKNASSVLIQRNGVYYLYDCGRGTANQLANIGLKQDDIEVIILSHYHPDHTTDLLPYMHAASWSKVDKRTKDLTIYGQPGLEDFLEKLFMPFGKRELYKDYSLYMKELSLGTSDILGNNFSFTDLHHSYGISFEEEGKRYSIMADSRLHDDLIGALSGVDFGIFDSGHITDEEIVEVAVKSQAKILVCSHQYRKLNESELNKTARDKGYTGKLIVAEDLMEFEL